MKKKLHVYPTCIDVLERMVEVSLRNGWKGMIDGDVAIKTLKEYRRIYGVTPEMRKELGEKDNFWLYVIAVVAVLGTVWLMMILPWRT